MKKLAAAVLLLLAAVAWGAAAFKLSADAGATKTPAGLTDTKFPPPAAPRDPVVPTAITLDIATRALVPGRLAVPATATEPAQPLVPDSWGPWTSYRRDFMPSDVTFEQGREEMFEYVQVHVRGEDGDPLAAIYCRGDLRTLQSLRDKARGANPAWNVTFDEVR